MNENLDSVTHDELKEAFLKLLSEKIHKAIHGTLFPAAPACVQTQEEYHKITAQVSREAAELFFKLVGDSNASKTNQ